MIKTKQIKKLNEALSSIKKILKDGYGFDDNSELENEQRNNLSRDEKFHKADERFMINYDKIAAQYPNDQEVQKIYDKYQNLQRRLGSFSPPDLHREIFEEDDFEPSDLEIAALEDELNPEKGK